jgi:tetratricopeptide (TPR) repeat protein
VLLAASVLTIGMSVRAQKSVGAATRPSITVLDSTKEQDGLIGSVRRVKTETAKIELKDGRAVEGPAQLVEVTTYGIKGNRIENTSYPIGGSPGGKEEYKYDPRGNITEMTLRDDQGAIISREAYTYEFDKFGNWTRMVTSLVVFENGELKKEPVEVTYRRLTYYFDDTVAKAVEEQVPEPVRETVPEPIAEPIPEPIAEPIAEPILASPVPEPVTEIQEVEVLKVDAAEVLGSIDDIGEPPAVPNPIITDQIRANDFYLAGRVQFDAGDVRGAVELYLQSVKLEPGSAEVFLNLGHAYLKLEKDREAIKAFKESIKLNPEDAETYYGLGFANFGAKRFHEAADAFKKATTLDPKMAKAHYGLGLAYQEVGDTHGLMEQYRILENLDRNLALKLAQAFPKFYFPCRLIMGCP